MKRWPLLSVAAVIAAVGIGYFALGTTKPKAPNKVVVAQVADFFLYAPIYVAKDAGFFAKNNLDVQITSTGGDEKAWAAVISGAAQFGVGDPTFVAIADQRGQPGRVVASIVNGVPFWGISLRSDIPEIHGAKELKPYSVATFPSPSTAYTLQAEMFRLGGLEPNIRQGAFGALIPMLQARQADIALELEPNVSTAVANLHAKVIYSLADQYGDFAMTALTATPKYLTDNPDVTRRMVCSIRQALNFIRSDPTASLHILTARFPELSAGVAASALQRAQSKGVIPTQAEVSPKAWEKAIQLRIKAGDLAAAKPMTAYVDNTFANEADHNCAAK